MGNHKNFSLPQFRSIIFCFLLKSTMSNHMGHLGNHGNSVDILDVIP